MTSKPKPDSSSKNATSNSDRANNSSRASQNARTPSNSSKPLFTVGVQSSPSQPGDLWSGDSQRTSVGGGGFYDASKYAHDRLESQKTVGPSVSSAKADRDSLPTTTASAKDGQTHMTNTPAGYTGSSRTSVGGVDFFGVSKHRDDDLANAKTKKAQATANTNQFPSTRTDTGPSKQPSRTPTLDRGSTRTAPTTASGSSQFPAGTQNARFSEPSGPDFQPSTGSRGAVAAATSTGSRSVQPQNNHSVTRSQPLEQNATASNASVAASARASPNSSSRPTDSRTSNQQRSERQSASHDQNTQSQVSSGNKPASSPDGNPSGGSQRVGNSQRTNATSAGSQAVPSKRTSISQSTNPQSLTAAAEFPPGDDNARFTSTTYSGRISQGPTTGGTGTVISSGRTDQRSGSFRSQAPIDAERAIPNQQHQVDVPSRSTPSQNNSQPEINTQASSQRRNSERSNTSRLENHTNPQPVQANAQPLAGRASQATGGGWGGNNNQNFDQNEFSSNDNAQQSQATGFGFSQNTTLGGSRRSVSAIGGHTGSPHDHPGDRNTGLSSTPSLSTDPSVGNLFDTDIDGGHDEPTTMPPGTGGFGMTSPGPTFAQARLPMWVTPSLANAYGSEIIAMGQPGYDRNHGGSNQNSPRFFKGQEDTDILNVIDRCWDNTSVHPFLHDQPMILVDHALAEGTLVDFGRPAPGVIICKASLTNKWLVKATWFSQVMMQGGRGSSLLPLFIMGGFLFFALFDVGIHPRSAVRQALGQGDLPAGIGPRLVEFFGLRPGCDRS